MIVKDSLDRASLDCLLDSILKAQAPTQIQAPQAACDQVLARPDSPGLIGRLARNIKGMLKSVIGGSTRKSRDYLNAPLFDELTRFQASQNLLAEGLHKHIQNLQKHIDLIHEKLELGLRRRHVDCGPERVLIQSEVGALLFSRKDTIGLSQLLATGELCRGQRALLQKLLQPGDAYIDAGTQQTYYCLAAAGALRLRGKCSALVPFETDQKLLLNTLQIHELEKKVRIIQGAPAGQKGRGLLFVGDQSHQHALVSHANVQSCVEVDLVSLDEFLPEDPVPTVIRLGYPQSQIAIFQGAPLLAQRESAWIVEFDAKALADNGQTPKEWRSAFEEQGFVMRVIDPQTGQLEHWLQERLCAAGKASVLFARPLAAFWRKAGAL